MYCYNCGTRIEPSDIFCAHCGARLIDGAQPEASVVSAYFDFKLPKAKGNNVVAEGYILTDIPRLAALLKVNALTVRAILGDFVSIRAAEGVAYKVLDLALFPGQNDGKWQSCQQILHRQYQEDQLRKSTPRYLFIIGGDDIVPMPVLPLAINDDDTVDTDLPYAYLHGADTVTELLNCSIFGSQIMLFCGRLPVASNATMADFITMLNNTLNVGYNGLPRRYMHVQSDPNWKVITMLATRGMEDNVMQSDADSAYYYGPVMLTPQFDPANTSFAKAFPYQDADVFYYNVHGINTPGVDNFSGQEENGGKFHCALRPQDMASVANLNAVMTEACYGGWFKTSITDGRTKKKEETVLLASLHANTVSYVGSSRVAYGFNNALWQHGLQNADGLAHKYLGYLYAALPAAVALHSAKIDVLENTSKLETARITVLEFNLFGDPSLTILPCNVEDGKGTVDVLAARTAEGTGATFTVDYDANSSGGLLATVRQLVDNSLREKDRMMQQYLYDTWGMEGCTLKRVVSAESRSGTKETSFLYQGETGSVIVTVDKLSHEIKDCVFER